MMNGTLRAGNVAGPRILHAREALKHTSAGLASPERAVLYIPVGETICSPFTGARCAVLAGVAVKVNDGAVILRKSTVLAPAAGATTYPGKAAGFGPVCVTMTAAVPIAYL